MSQPTGSVAFELARCLFKENGTSFLFTVLLSHLECRRNLCTLKLRADINDVDHDDGDNDGISPPPSLVLLDGTTTDQVR